MSFIHFQRNRRTHFSKCLFRFIQFLHQFIKQRLKHISLRQSICQRLAKQRHHLHTPYIQLQLAHITLSCSSRFQFVVLVGGCGYVLVSFFYLIRIIWQRRGNFIYKFTEIFYEWFVLLDVSECSLDMKWGSEQIDELTGMKTLD